MVCVCAEIEVTKDNSQRVLVFKTLQARVIDQMLSMYQQVPHNTCEFA